MKRWMNTVLIFSLSTLLVGGCFDHLQRRLYGVKPGVSINGEPVGRLYPDEVVQVLEKIGSETERDPVPARFDKRGKIVAEEWGVSLDLAGTLTLIIEAGPEEAIEPLYRAVQPRVTADVLVQIDTVLGSYTTWLIGSADRASNIRLANQTMDYTVVLPGEVFSFNEVVGPRSGERGYKPAPVIVGESVVPGYGGGVCQSSSTLYNAVLRARLEVVQRSPHSKRVSYVPIGKDATVSYPDLDLKFRNNRETPILVRSGVSGYRVWAEIWGIKP